MGFNHRVPALSTAIIASAALTLAILAGLSCEFLNIDADPDNVLIDPEGIQTSETSTSIGLLCENEDEIYDMEDDRMWFLSWLFLLIALGLGGFTCLLAWAVSTFLPPTEFNWRLLSFCASITAVIQVPIFLIFESEPCSEYKENQSCSLGLGSYYLMASVVFYVAVTLATQLLDPPEWAMELSAWRVGNTKSGQSRPPREINGADDDPSVVDLDQAEAYMLTKRHLDKSDGKQRSSTTGWFGGGDSNHPNLRANSTESPSDDDFDVTQQQFRQQQSQSYTRSPSVERSRRRPSGTSRSVSTRSRSRMGNKSLDSRIEITDEGKTVRSEERYSNQRRKLSPQQQQQQRGSPANSNLQSTSVTSKDFDLFVAPKVVDLDSKVEFTDEEKTAISQERFQSIQRQQELQSLKQEQQQQQPVLDSGDGFVMSPLRVASRESQQEGLSSQVSKGDSSPPRVRRVSNYDAIQPDRNVSLLDANSSFHDMSTTMTGVSNSQRSTPNTSYENYEQMDIIGSASNLNTTNTSSSPLSQSQQQRSQGDQKTVYAGLNSFIIQQVSNPNLSGAAILSDLKDDEEMPPPPRLGASPLRSSSDHSSTLRLQQQPNHRRQNSSSSVEAQTAAALAALSSNAPQQAIFGSPSQFTDNDEDDNQNLINQDDKQDDDDDPYSNPGRVQKYSSGLRAFTSKIKKENTSRRRKSRRRVKQRRGYTQMLDDDYYSDDSIEDNHKTPPFEVKLDRFPMRDNADLMNEITDDEQAEMMDDWNALHKATVAGVHNGMHEENSFDSFGFNRSPEEEKHEELPPPTSYHESNTYHSDPEPEYYESEPTLSMAEEDNPYYENEGDNSTLSSASSQDREAAYEQHHDKGSYDKSGRVRGSRSGGGGRGRRHRRSTSSVCSIKSSVSLLDVAINEETVEDIVAESSAGEEELLRSGYNLQRTKSAPPASRRSSGDRIELSRELGFSIRAPASPTAANMYSSQTNENFERTNVQSESRVVTPASQANEERNAPSKQFFSKRDSHQIEADDPEPHFVSSSEEIRRDEEMETGVQSAVAHRSFEQARPLSEFERKRLDRAKSHSPARSRKLNSFEWKDDLEPTGMMMRGRAAASKNQMNLESTGEIDLVERARQIRKRRLQNQKLLRNEIPSFDEGESVESNAKNISRDSTESVVGSVMGSVYTSDLPFGSDAIVNDFADSSVQTDSHRSGNLSDGSQGSFKKYGSTSVMDDLDLQLTLVKRPLGVEYGDDEASL